LRLKVRPDIKVQVIDERNKLLDSNGEYQTPILKFYMETYVDDDACQHNQITNTGGHICSSTTGSRHGAGTPSSPVPFTSEKDIDDIDWSYGDETESTITSGVIYGWYSGAAYTPPPTTDSTQPAACPESVFDTKTDCQSCCTNLNYGCFSYKDKCAITYGAAYNYSSEVTMNDCLENATRCSDFKSIFDSSTDDLSSCFKSGSDCPPGGKWVCTTVIEYPFTDAFKEEQYNDCMSQ